MHALENGMTKLAHMADLTRLEDEIDEAILHCSTDDQMIVELKRRQSHLKEEIERLRRQAIGQGTLH
jgi:hypothetical protein